MKRLILFDIDGVIYEGHTIFDQIQYQEKRGILPSGTWDKIYTELSAYKEGKKNYVDAANVMLTIAAKAVDGKDYGEYLKDVADYVSDNRKNFFEYFAKLVPFLIEKYDIYFVTTNFQFMCEAIGEIFGVKNYISSIAEVENGKFTGKITRSMAGNKGLVADLISKYGRSGSIAVGDSENDADMLNKVEHPLVMEPNEKLKAIAVKNGWRIVNRDNITETILEYS